VKILILAANPVDVVSRLRIDTEVREIGQKIRFGSLRDQVEVIPELAVRADDLPELLLRHHPDVVHFSGHCSPSGEIILEDKAGNRKVVSKDAFADLFSILKDNIRVVLLNACHGSAQARALAKVIDFAIGMDSAIEDGAAIVFASHFYQTLAFGRTVKESFELAVTQLRVEGFDEANAPELFVRDGANPLAIVEPTKRVADAVDSATRVVPRLAAFSSWLFGGVALSLSSDILRRFLGGEAWVQLAAVIAESFLGALSVLAAILMTIFLISPANRVVTRAARLGSGDARKSRRAVLLSGAAVVIVLGIWLSLPFSAHYYNERGIRFQYSEQPNLSRALASYQQAVRLKPNYAQAHYNLAAVQEDLQPERAIEEYLLVIRYDSRIYAAYNNLARLYLLRGRDNDYENALSILNQAVDLSPQDESVRYSLDKNLGWANYALKHYSLAEMFLRKAISLRDPQGGAAAHCLLAYVLKEQGKSGVADECFDCVSLASGEPDVEAKWVSDAKECLIKGDKR
jgi:tetratricopeptide (TPR) repeat protein